MTNQFRFNIAEDFDHDNEIIEVELSGTVELNDANYVDMSTVDIDEEYINKGFLKYKDLPSTIKHLIKQRIERQIYA